MFFTSGIGGNSNTQAQAISAAFASLGVATAGQTAAQLQATCIAWSAGKTQAQINLALLTILLALIDTQMDLLGS